MTRKDKIINVDPYGDFESAIKTARKILLSGRLVAYPTESFYGLAVDTGNEEAIRHLFSAKNRRPDSPILILIPSVESLTQYVSHIPPVAKQLIEAFWPGGLTLVFEAGRETSPLLTAGTGKIGIRLPNHPVATALAGSIGRAITGTSANMSGRPPCRNADEVLHSFQEEVDLILDGGKTTGETGSTILDVTVDPPLILREGMVSRRQLENFIQVKCE